MSSGGFRPPAARATQRPSIARPVAAGEAVPTGAPDANANAICIFLNPTPETSAYELSCTQYTSSMMKKEGWYGSVPPERLAADGSVPEKQAGAHLVDETGGKHGRDCAHCGKRYTTFVCKKKSAGGMVRTFPFHVSLRLCETRAHPC